MARKKILIVDDEPSVRMVVAKQMSPEFEVMETSNGIQTFDICVHERPDLVLLDIMMPQKDGYSVLKDLKEDSRTEKIPVVIVSGIDFPLNKILASQLGAAGYLTKPFSGSELKMQISNALKPQRKFI